MGSSHYNPRTTSTDSLSALRHVVAGITEFFSGHYSRQHSSNYSADSDVAPGTLSVAPARVSPPMPDPSQSSTANAQSATASAGQSTFGTPRDVAPPPGTLVITPHGNRIDRAFFTRYLRRDWKNEVQREEAKQQSSRKTMMRQKSTVLDEDALSPSSVDPLGALPVESRGISEEGLKAAQGVRLQPSGTEGKLGGSVASSRRTRAGARNTVSSRHDRRFSTPCCNQTKSAKYWEV